MSIVYFTIIFFFIILLLVISYVVYSKVKQSMDERKITQVVNKMRPIFDKHMELDNVLDIPKNELEDMRKKVLTKAGLQAFNFLYFTRRKQDGLTDKLHNYVNYVVDYQTIYKNRIVRDIYRKSYILFLCAEYYMKSDEVIHFALESLNDKSIYVRNNALKVIRNTGNIDAFIEAYYKISHGKLYFNNKVIVDFIGSFQGDTQELNKALAIKLTEFSPRFQKNIIDHFSNRKINEYSHEVLTLIMKTSDKEVVVAGIKYFGNIYNQDAYKFIVKMFDSEDYEIRAVCARTIALYPCEETILLLKKYITDPNWFVRYNCAFTLLLLEQENVFNEESPVGEIIRGNDHFAKEIMIYTLYSQGLINSENIQERLATLQVEDKKEEDTLNEFRKNHPVY